MLVSIHHHYVIIKSWFMEIIQLVDSVGKRHATTEEEGTTRWRN